MKTLVSTIAISVLFPLIAFAAPIPGIFNTGVDDDGNLLGNGAVDPHYEMTVSADFGFPGPEAVTLNPVFRGFDFAVAIANAGDKTANIIITQGDDTVQELELEVDSLEVVKLPWVLELKGDDVDACQITPEPGNSRFAEGAAYRIRSDSPVSVFQFSPLQYEIEDEDGNPPNDCPLGVECNAMFGSEECLSYSNDASLLLPATSLTGDYTVVSWPSVGNTTSFFTITATEDATVVKLDNDLGLFRAGGGVKAMGKSTITMNRAKWWWCR